METLAQKKRRGGEEEAGDGKKEVGGWINVDLHLTNLVAGRKVWLQEETDLVAQYFH